MHWLSHLRLQFGAPRVGGAAEVFVGPYFEARVMARHAFSKVAATGDVTDLLIFAHAAF